MDIYIYLVSKITDSIPENHAKEKKVHGNNKKSSKARVVQQ
jgi:hypothetical protein